MFCRTEQWLNFPVFPQTASWNLDLKGGRLSRCRHPALLVHGMDHSASSKLNSESPVGLNLFLTGFLVLFLELASIRWFSANVIFLQYFTNVVLLACFLGMSCGCLAARQRRDWLAYFPILALGAILAALALLKIFNFWHSLTIDVGHQASPQEVFFGTEFRDESAQFTVPIDVISAIFFVLIALMFVGLGQVLGRAFD